MSEYTQEDAEILRAAGDELIRENKKLHTRLAAAEKLSKAARLLLDEVHEMNVANRNRTWKPRNPEMTEAAEVQGKEALAEWEAAK